MKGDCPSPESWLPLVGEAGIEEDLAAHLAACPECRLDARAMLAERETRRRWIPWAAAASLLLAAGIAHRTARPSAPSPSPASRPPRIAEDSRRLWLRAPAFLDTPFGRLVLEEGQAGVALEEPRSVQLLREAWAGETVSLSLVLLEGARARLGAEAWSGPSRIRLEAGSRSLEALTPEVLAEALSWRDGEGDWTELPAASVGVPRAEARDLLFPVPAEVRSLVLEAEIREPAGSQTELCFPWRGATVSTSLDAGAGWRTVRLRLEGDRVEILSGARMLVSARVLPESRRLAGGPQAGIRVWQGPVEVRRLRWRPLS